MHWILKTEPGEYSYADLEHDKTTRWDGVRNYQARNNLRSMKAGEQCLIYESVGPKQIVGTAHVAQTAYPDPKDPNWSVVDIRVGQRLAQPISLETLKNHPVLKELSLVKQSRLSVCPVTDAQFKEIEKLFPKRGLTGK